MGGRRSEGKFSTIIIGIIFQAVLKMTNIDMVIKFLMLAFMIIIETN